ncbi:MAG: hypothetical protein ACRDJI_02905 [Actinomycetota bacterium]
MARETRYRVIYFDENKKEVYNEDFHTFHDMLVEGQPLAPPPHVKRTEVWMTHLLSAHPSPNADSATRFVDTSVSTSTTRLIAGFSSIVL